MNFCHMKKVTPALVLGACLLLGDAAQGATYFLRAAKTTKTMPDGRQVEMWGFARESSFGARNGEVQVPGPELRVQFFDPQLRIIVTNELPVPVSIVIPGLYSRGMFINGVPAPIAHSRMVDSENRSRATSFANEVPPNNNVMYDFRWYSFTNSGTFIYHSGSHAALQVQMGLYGAVKKHPSQGNNYAYPNVMIDAEETIFLSEIDPDLHDAVASGNYGPGKLISSTIDSKPKYFLINGKCASTSDLWKPVLTTSVGKTVLLRFLNACGDTRIPTLLNSELTVLAEDGNLAPYSSVQSALTLPALKTLDAIWKPNGVGMFPLFDQRGGLVTSYQNNLGQTVPGGVLTYLAVTNLYRNTTPIVVPASGPANIYPASIQVNNAVGSIKKIKVTLNGINHPNAQDLDIALVGPDGTSVLLMSDIGFVYTGVNLTLDPDVPYLILHSNEGPVTYTKTPRNFTLNDPFPNLTPPFINNIDMNIFKGKDPNGTWSLYVVDDNASTAGGSISGGWALDLQLEP